jgi:lambda family phage portal protein
MFERQRDSLARLIAPRRPGARATRQYHSAKASRLTSGWNPANSSADKELESSLTVLRNRSRSLVRDAPYAKRTKVVIVNNVIGNGIPFQAQVRTNDGKLTKRVNDGIERAWCEWTEAPNCHTGGALHFHDLERAAFGQIFEAGEVFHRMHMRAFGESPIRIALEMVEAERLADQFAFPGTVNPNHVVRMGVEVDRFHRAQAYWLRQNHPNTFETGHYGLAEQIERVTADQIMHLRVIDRWPQTRGEPWMHAVIRKLNDMDGYSEAEIVAARAAANYLASIETPDGQTTLLDEQAADGSSELPLEPGEVRRMGPGEKLNFHAPNRPNAAMDPFMRMMLREVAAGAGVSYESVSRDYSQSNYSSSRLALLEDRDLWRVHQGLWLRSFRVPFHRIWLRQAVLARAIPEISIEAYALDPKKFEAAMFKPRGWSWVDPTKEVAAYKSAVRAGFMTVADVIALTGGGQDLEQVLDGREQELEMMHDKGLVFDTDPERDAKGAEVAQETAPADNPPASPDDQTEQDPPARVFSIQR